MERALTVASWVITIAVMLFFLMFPFVVVYQANGVSGLMLLIGGVLIVGIILAAIDRAIDNIWVKRGE